MAEFALGADPVLSLDALDARDRGRVGSKAAGLATLLAAGLPVPDGFCLSADAYRAHLAAAGVEDVARCVAQASEHEARHLSRRVRLGLLETPLDTQTAERLYRAYDRLVSAHGPRVAVRSSALHEGSVSASYAGQLETLLGVVGPDDLAIAVRACWASLWSARAAQYSRERGDDPSGTAVALLVQRLITARVAGGGVSVDDNGQIALTAAWGLGAALAQGEVIPDRYALRREPLALESVEVGYKERRMVCPGGTGARWQSVEPESVSALCLSEEEMFAIARLVLNVEHCLGSPVEVEWALDTDGIHLLQVQARPTIIAPRRAARQVRSSHPPLQGQPVARGWAAGPACVARSENELDLVKLGDILVTRVPGPSLSLILGQVAGIVAELGGSTSHLAALARERGIPAVFGVRQATRQIPPSSRVSVDGTSGLVYFSEATLVE